MVNTQLLRVQNVHTKYRKFFCWFLNSRLLNFAENLANINVPQIFPLLCMSVFVFSRNWDLEKMWKQ